MARLFGGEAQQVAEKQFPFTLSDAEWRQRLTPEQFAVLRGHATERPGACALNYEKRAGFFSCAGCRSEKGAVSMVCTSCNATVARLRVETILDTLTLVVASIQV